MSKPKPPNLSTAKRPRGRKSKWDLRTVRTWLFAGVLIAGLTIFTLSYLYYSAVAGLIPITVVKEMPDRKSVV